MEKKAYITPEVVIEDIELEATMQSMSEEERKIVENPVQWEDDESDPNYADGI